MSRVFLYTSLLLLLTSISFSTPIQFVDDDINNDNDNNLIDTDLDEYINNDDSSPNLFDNKLSDLSISAKTRGNSYSKVLTLVKSLQDGIDKEHTDLTRIFNAETKEHSERKKQLDEARQSVLGLKNSLQESQWKIGNLTDTLSIKGYEHTKVINTIDYHNKLLKKELATVEKFYSESNKYKNYKEFPEIKSQIDELKLAVQKETTDIIDIYSKLSNKIGNDLVTKNKELQIFKDQVKTFNTTLNSQTQNYNDLYTSFQKFVDNYTKSSKQYQEATNSYNEEKELLTQLASFLQQTDTQKCLKVSQENSNLNNQIKTLQEENKTLKNKLNSSGKHSNSKSSSSGKKVIPGKVVSQTKSK